MLFGFVQDSTPGRRRGHFPLLEVLCTPWAVSDVAGQVVSLVHFGFPVLKLLKTDAFILDWRLWPNTS